MGRVLQFLLLQSEVKMKKKWWEEAFVEGKYPLGEIFYSKGFVRQTEKEIKFLKKRFNLKKGAEVLDLCCGVGRHSVALAKLGLNMTSLDASPVYLQTARKKAKSASVKINFQQADARKLQFQNCFDFAFTFYGCLGYFENIEDDRRVLKGLYKALKPGGVLALSIYNSDRQRNVLKFLKEHAWLSSQWVEMKDENLFVLANMSHDNKKKAFQTQFIFLKGKDRKELMSFNRDYSLIRLSRELKSVGFRIESRYGGVDGTDYDALKSQNLMLVAKKV